MLTPLEEIRAYQSIFAEGKTDDLKRLLARRLGPLPPWAVARINAAPLAQLDAWLDGIFDAPALEALLGSPPPRRRKPLCQRLFQTHAHASARWPV